MEVDYKHGEKTMQTMNIKYFQKTIEIAAMFGDKLQMPNKQNAYYWLERIEKSLSPENLSCDGELRGAQLNTKRNDLLAAKVHCLTIFGAIPTVPDMSAYHLYQQAAEQRTADRQSKLRAAVSSGFSVGARIRINNGVLGTIIKINRTRVKVAGDDQRMWSVPPRCMTLAKN